MRVRMLVERIGDLNDFAGSAAAHEPVVFGGSSEGSGDRRHGGQR